MAENIVNKDDTIKKISQEIIIITKLPGPLSALVLENSRNNTSAGLSVNIPITVDSAYQAILKDLDGNQIVDLGSGIGVNNVGHSHSKVILSVADQVKKFTHTNFTTAPYSLYVEVSTWLNQNTPGDFPKKTILQNSGAEAVENAIKIARHYTKKPAIVTFEHSYHGRTNLTMALTSKVMPYKDGFGPFAPEIYRMPMPYSFRYLGKPENIALDSIEEIKLKIEKEIGFNNLAAIIIEPILGEGGFIVPPIGFLPALQKLASDNNVLFILDEVQTGFARTGNLFAADFEALTPDLIITAKALAAGLPLSAVTGRAEVMDSSHVGGLGGTYGGNPIACAAALAVFEIINEEKLVDRANKIGEILKNRLTKMQEKYAIIGEVRGRGAMQAIELVKPGGKTPYPEAVKTIVKNCQNKGVLLLTAGTYNNVIRFLPPLVIDFALLENALDILEEEFNLFTKLEQ
jgi:4-aminobutyrate aminotransferase/(S)-3-amino-2-methylpropionate transaminase